MSAKDAGGLFGRIALKKGLVSEESLALALRLQEECRAFGVQKPLGKLLVTTGALTPDAVERILKLQRRNENKRRSKRFAQVAVLNGFVPQEAADRARAQAKQEGHRRGVADLLVEQGSLTRKVVRAIRRAIQQADAEEQDPEKAGSSDTTRFFPTDGFDIQIERDADAPATPAQDDPRGRDLLFAAVALRDGLVLVSELERALEEQSYRHDAPRLEEVLIGRGVLTLEQVDTVERALDDARRDRVKIPGYEATDLLGHGSTSIVLRARHELIDREVAIKVFREEHMARAKADELISEARTIARIRHPNVVGLHEVGQVQRRFYCVMELIDGPTLIERIRQEGHIPEDEALRCARDVARGLQAIADAGLVHRDVKPHNILLTKEGALLTDLGLAREAGDMVTSGMIYGTPHTISPEQAQGEHVDARSDLYGLGATLFYALTGEPPFDGDDPLRILLAHINDPVPDPRLRRPEISASAARLVIRLLQKKPEDRLESPSALVKRIDKILAKRGR